MYSLFAWELGIHVPLSLVGDFDCWGKNENEELGLGDSTNRHSPTTVSGLDDVVKVAMEGSHSCAVKGNGQVLGCTGAGLITSRPRHVLAKWVHN